MPLLHLSALAASALGAAIWQGTLLALAVALILRMIPAISSAARSLIWMAVFALAFLFHFAPVLTHAKTSAPTSSPGLHLNPAWSLAIVAVWALFALARAIQLTVSAAALHRVARRAHPIAAPDACAALLAASPRRVQLCTSSDVDRPSVAGFFHPRILVPSDLLTALTDAELAQVLLHELEHIRRCDDWTNLLQKLALVVFPLNPALLYIERRLCAERELACDDRVLSTTGAPKAYAICLTHLAERTLLHRTLSLALGAWRAPSELTRRVTRILAAPARALSPRATSALVAAAFLTLIAASVELAHSPQLISFLPPPTALGAATPALSAIDTQLSADGSSPAGPHLTLTRATVAAHPPTRLHNAATLRRPDSARGLDSARSLDNARGLDGARSLDTVQRLAPTVPRSAPRQTLTSFDSSPADSSQPPVRVIYAVATTTRRISYAAVAVPGGWIIIPIQQTTLTLNL